MMMRSFLFSLLFLPYLIFGTSTAYALSATQTAKLLAADIATGDSLGSSVSVSGDTAVIGSYGNDDNGSNSGSAYVFTRDSSGNWSQQAKLLAVDGAAGDWFGVSVSVSGDTAIIGSHEDDDNGIGSGSAYVFTRDSSGSWSQQAKLLAADGTSTDSFGRSVSVSGNTAVIGSWRDDDNGSDSGSAYVFTRDNSGNWSQQAKLLAADGAYEDYFGISVSVSGDTAVIGSHFDDDNGSDSGSAYVFTRDSSNNWTQQGKLLSNDGPEYGRFGFSVSVSGDTAVIGSYGNDDNGNDSGSAYVFTRDSSGIWSQQAKFLAVDGAAGDWFGFSVSMSGDTAIIGSLRDDDNGSNAGSAYVFTRDNSGNWAQ